MRKSLFAAACVVALAVPLCAFAAFSRPSEVLSALIYDGKPGQFDGKFYVSVGAEPDVVRFFGQVRGMSEGLTPKDIKSSLHADITATTSEGDIKGAVDMMAYREKLYVRLTDVAVKVKDTTITDDTFLSSLGLFQNRWFVLDLAEVPTEGLEEIYTSSDDFNLTPEQWKQTLAIVADAMFSLEHTRFQTGNSYLLTLKPDAWAEALTSAINGLDAVNPDVADMLSSEDILPVLSTTADVYANALTVRAKVDTTNEGDFRFARIYATLNLPDESDPVSLAIEGTLEHRLKPVYLDLPKITEPLESVLGDFFSLPETPSEEFPPFEDDWTTPTEEPELSPPVERPLELPPPAPSCSPQGTIRGADLSTREPCPGGHESRRAIRARNVGELNR